MRKFSNEAVVGPNIGRDFLSQVGLGRTSDAMLHYAPELQGTPLKAAREHANAASKDPHIANAVRKVRLTNRAPLLAGGLSAITGAGGGAIAGGLGRMAGGWNFWRRGRCRGHHRECGKWSGWSAEWERSS